MINELGLAVVFTVLCILIVLFAEHGEGMRNLEIASAVGFDACTVKGGTEVFCKNVTHGCVFYRIGDGEYMKKDCRQLEARE